MIADNIIDEIRSFVPWRVNTFYAKREIIVEIYVPYLVLYIEPDRLYDGYNLFCIDDYIRYDRTERFNIISCIKLVVQTTLSLYEHKQFNNDDYMECKII